MMMLLKKIRSDMERTRLLGKDKFVMGRLRVRKIQVELSRLVARAQETDR